jgi:hypothetical protein
MHQHGAQATTRQSARPQHTYRSEVCNRHAQTTTTSTTLAPCCVLNDQPLWCGAKTIHSPYHPADQRSVHRRTQQHESAPDYQQSEPKKFKQSWCVKWFNGVPMLRLHVCSRPPAWPCCPSCIRKFSCACCEYMTNLWQRCCRGSKASVAQHPVDRVSEERLRLRLHAHGAVYDAAEAPLVGALHHVRLLGPVLIQPMSEVSNKTRGGHAVQHSTMIGEGFSKAAHLDHSIDMLPWADACPPHLEQAEAARLVLAPLRVGDAVLATHPIQLCVPAAAALLHGARMK